MNFTDFAMPSTSTKEAYQLHRQQQRAYSVSFVCLALLMSILTLLLTSCSIAPVVYTDAKGRDVAWLGGSLVTRSKDHMASITRPDGTVISTRTVGKDETAVPRYWVQAQAAEAIAGIAGSVSKNAANNATARVASNDAVRSTAITAPLAAQTEQARIAAEAATQ